MAERPASSPAGPAAAAPGAAASVEVAAGLIFRRGKLLIAQRLPDAHLAGLWEFPGGKREPDETFEACLERELREELGVAVRVRELLSEIVHEYPAKSVHLRFYRCELGEEEPRALGCGAVAWITLEELDRYEFPAADVRLLERLRQTPQLWR
jgi:mutator protein MutT